MEQSLLSHDKQKTLAQRTVAVEKVKKKQCNITILITVIKVCFPLIP